MSTTIKTFESIDKIAFSGGGFRGCIHIGVLKYLEEIKLVSQLKYVAGTSIGALVALMVCLGYQSDELNDLIMQFDYQKYQSINFIGLLDQFGLDTFENLSHLIGSYLIKKQFSPNIDFITLYQKTHKHLIMNAVCLNTHSNTFFDHILTPNIPVLVALQASMAVPYIFTAVRYKGLIYVDGGLLDNLIIDYPDFISKPETLLAIDLNLPETCSIREISTLEQFSGELFTCLHNGCKRLNNQSSLKTNIIAISAPQYSLLNFNLSKEGKVYLIDLGYKKTKEYFNHH